jgi:transcriptional regulator with XRE-family HTH domain
MVPRIAPCQIGEYVVYMVQEPEEAKPKQKRVVAADEGARYTKQLMAEVTRLRLAKTPRWSAERLAEEMTKVGVPWTRSTVNNLESGRRKHIAVHEVLALAYVLDVRTPLDLLAPEDAERVWVTPLAETYPDTVRRWFAGQLGLSPAMVLKVLKHDPAEVRDRFLRDLAGMGYTESEVRELLAGQDGDDGEG